MEQKKILQMETKRHCRLLTKIKITESEGNNTNAWQVTASLLECLWVSIYFTLLIPKEIQSKVLICLSIYKE